MKLINFEILTKEIYEIGQDQYGVFGDCGSCGGCTDKGCAGCIGCLGDVWDAITKDDIEADTSI